MKHIIKIALITILSTGFLNAQAIVNEVKTTKIKTFKNENGQLIKAKIVNHELQPLVLKASERNDINQDLAYSPSYVKKYIFIDKDEDAAYDKKIKLTYAKDLYSKTHYITPVEGLSIKVSGDLTANNSIEEYNYSDLDK